MPKDKTSKEAPTKYRSAFRVLFSYAKPHRRTFALMIVCTLLAIAADLFQPYLVKIAIDDHLMAGDTNYVTLVIICAIYLGLSLTGLLFTYLQNNLLQYAGQSIVARIRKELFEHITKQSMSYFDRMPSGSLITHVSSDTETINQFFNQVLLSLIRDGLTLVFIIVLMFQLDVELTLYCLILLPIIAAIAISFRSYMRKTYQMTRANLSRLVAFVAENLAGMNLIQAFHQEKEQQSQFTDKNHTYYRSNLREIRTNVLFNRSFDILGNLSVAFVTWLGGIAVFDKQLEFGVLYAFITYIRMFFQPINTITQQWNTLQSTTVSVSRIWGIFSVQPEVTDAAAPKQIAPETVRGKIDFNRVTFSYVENQPVIRDIDLHIAPGSLIGIVGTTGAGKSSLIGLLCRFYDVQKGSIKIDGTDIRDIPQNTLHRIVGLVQQEPYLYSGSIIDNVRLFDESISREDVIRACKFVGADAVIARMKDGYDTRLSERGSGLSAGERQMISFARIIVFQPKVLILDEATANLDSYTEQLIQSALAVVSQGRTTLVIAHRLSTIMQADRILVMRSGEIVEQGDHGELLELHGYYEQLYKHSQGNMRGAG
ncbi:ATP-binding cassette, subfamily B [Paenibacillus sp. UNCCL117]|uniref:ABC transporter ATP-binding protein n=1 Tax=unclassified Paenibacillus TaxID=185978 RepID=UPI00087EA074|nr:MULTISPECIES: ABC transporter ATP-binding protein [unclassified Paenibacillus]SDD39966.1 ATP-binding cassette, subfamily B [Paenibacillus sp. cl123]SFW48233.1 ATP-binding cassette, subfamily B [Paenibacillus sp. UNCCL117]